MQSLEATGIFDDAYDDREEVGADADINNLETTMNVSSIPTTRIHKDHPIEQIIRDLHSASLTRRMSQQNLKELGLNPKRIEAIRLFLAYASFMGLIVYQMDVESAFLYGTIEEEVYVCQPLGFEDPQFPDKVYKVEKALYGLYQALRAWYETLSTYLLENGYRRGTIDKILFIKKDRCDIQLVQVYLDDIIFGSTKKSLIASIVDEDGIFISQDKYMADILKKFNFVIWFHVTPKVSHLHVVKRIFRYLKCQPKIGLGNQVDSNHLTWKPFYDSDYARAILDRKSTTGGCQFLGKRLISSQCKKQTIVANSTTEAEYVAAKNCCGQVSSDNPLEPPTTISIQPCFHPLSTTVATQHQKTYKSRRAKRGRDTEIPQSSGPLKKVGDEAVYTGEDDK
ncbi:putative ribonuclease H-like domain-containing protein [Tanacetum coccineum]|uniref:Ribonuclease H-like domain-containing protein n=1 Tax=Tanacetum coccineum TaxID=301880 RepID=A0ABQ4XSD8_9ASTR